MESLVEKVRSASELETLAEWAVDVVLAEGVLMRTADQPNSSSVVQFAPFSLFTSPIPRNLYHQAITVQRDFNVLVHKIAGEGDFLKKTLAKTIEVDAFTRGLWNIYERVHLEGVAQKFQLGIHRSDYMIDVSGAANPSYYRLKQIEINTIASGFGGLSTRLTNAHKRILRRFNDTIISNAGTRISVGNIPPNEVTTNLARGMIRAVDLYLKDSQRSSSRLGASLKPAILFVTEEDCRNIFDQRLLENKINELRDDVVVLRRTLTEMARDSFLDERTKTLIVGDFEICVAYFRVGYAPPQYPSEIEWNERLKIERSLAIKCPSIGYHLVTTKKVQQAIAMPGILERFLDDHEAIKRLRDTFTGLYPLDDSNLGKKAISEARENPANFVLKPQREGGANNFYGAQIPEMLDQICGGDGKEKFAYILMDRIQPMEHLNVQMIPGVKIKVETMVSELGIYGIFIGNDDDIYLNEEAGHLLRTKQSFKDEGGVNAGFAGLDTPLLV